MESEQCAEFFLAQALDGLVAHIGVTAYSILMIICAAKTYGSPTSNLTLEEIAELVGKSVETTRAAIDVLKKFNLVAVERQGRNLGWALLARNPQAGVTHPAPYCFLGQLHTMALAQLLARQRRAEIRVALAHERHGPSP